MPTETLSGFRLSPQQERLWSLQQNGSAYGAFCAVVIEGVLNVSTLKAAVQNCVDRHDSLRSHFHRLPGMKTPVTIIAEQCLPQWEEMDWTSLNPQTQEIQVAKLLQAAQDCSEDLTQSSLLRVKLVQLSSDRHLVILSMPALCLDAWSLRLLVQEISDRYGQSTPDLTASEEVQYIQFSEWQHQLLTEEDAQAGQAYWQAVPLSTLVGLNLPFEGQFRKQIGQSQSHCTRPLNPPFLNARQGFELGGFEDQSHTSFQVEAWKIEVSISVMESFATQQNTSVRDVLLACWIILMSRLTAEPNLVMGYGCDRRAYPELHNTLGLLSTWLPLYCPLTPDLQFAEVLTLLAEKCRAAEEWQDYFVWNTESSEPSFFPLGFEFESGATHWSNEDLSFRLLQYHACIERFKLKLACFQHSETLELAFYYDAHQFSAEAVQSLAQQFQELLADAMAKGRPEVIAHPHQPISTLNLLSAEERQTLFMTCDPLQESHCIHHLFEVQVEQHPQEIALVYEDQQWTYAELNRQANQLAHYLQHLGVGAEKIVGIYLGRSPQSILALLAILKSGGAYLPLDPTLPAAAIAARLQSAQAAWVITEQSLVKPLPTLDSGIKPICLDTDWEVITQEAESNPTCEATPENLMYVLFTSGTTGQPKGVAVEHRQLHSYLCGILERLDVPARSSFATISTLAADLGNTVIFPALCTGGCLHLIAQERLSDPVKLGAYIQHHEIDCLKIVPSHLQALLNTMHPAQLLPQLCLVLGGEALSWEFVAQLQALKPDCRILNHYGPTETTVGVLTYAVPAQPVMASDETVPLGKPLAHTHVYVLDEHQQPVPKGLPGELYIGGATVARGYLHQPELTTERFIPHPFSSQVGQRLYKTGDRVRYLADGSLLFLGRLDRQVKVRGYRVELAGIESVLQQQSEVRQAVVSVRADQPGLVAYIVPQLPQPLNDLELKQRLRQQLPEYMVPATVVFLKALPLTANGKVDVQALPAPEARQPNQALTYNPPSTETEQAIAQIWQTALGLKSVGLHDNFFDLGGHSLLMVQVHSKLREKFQQDLVMGDLFRYPTIQALANHLNPSQPKDPPEDPFLQRSLDRAQTRKAIANRRRTPEVKDAAQ
ncbi:MAG: amino acid adenylation domain-containing protein [Acaryochloris sp. RU_4_1]|nr:amino acid adenylation domain-containing protein [Acaryochloris sp. RU_4_1]NJR53710.1 amino acid adenylation domain-containing protein [Acaryochloris sp. CRU_2_0]